MIFRGRVLLMVLWACQSPRSWFAYCLPSTCWSHAWRSCAWLGERFNFWHSAAMQWCIMSFPSRFLMINIYIYMAISVNFMASWLSSQVCYVLLRVNYYYIQSLTHEAWNVLAPPCQPMQTVGSSPFAWWAVRTDKLEFDGIRRRDHW